MRLASRISLYYKRIMGEEKDTMLNVRVPKAVKDAAQKAADDDQRSVSGLVLKVLNDWLTERGYLKPSTAPRKK